MHAHNWSRSQCMLNDCHLLYVFWLWWRQMYMYKQTDTHTGRVTDASDHRHMWALDLVGRVNYWVQMEKDYHWSRAHWDSFPFKTANKWRRETEIGGCTWCEGSATCTWWLTSRCECRSVISRVHLSAASSRLFLPTGSTCSQLQNCRNSSLAMLPTSTLKTWGTCLSETNN